MELNTIDDIFASNGSARRNLLDLVALHNEGTLRLRIEEEEWSILDVLEHVSLVNVGAVKICTRLLAHAEPAAENSAPIFSKSFQDALSSARDAKFNAPDTVRPSGKKTLAEVLASLEGSTAAMDGLREKFLALDHCGPRFPHPYFGDLSAAEWLHLSGEHEARHTAQIRRISETLKAREGGTSSAA